MSELVLEVVDLDEAERFYSGVLGLPVVERWPHRDAIWVMAGRQTRIGLWRPQVGLAGGRGGVHVHFALSISEEDFDPAVARLRDRGYRPEIVIFDDLRGRALYVDDPDHNVVELWVDNPRDAVAFYEAAFGAIVLHLVGEGDDIVAQLSVEEASFWVAGTSPALKRLSPLASGGTTSRTLLLARDPEKIVRRAVSAGAVETSPMADEHGWRIGRITDPFGHEWEIGFPRVAWPPDRETGARTT